APHGVPLPAMGAVRRGRTQFPPLQGAEGDDLPLRRRGDPVLPSQNPRAARGGRHRQGAPLPLRTLPPLRSGGVRNRTPGTGPTRRSPVRTRAPLTWLL